MSHTPCAAVGCFAVPPAGCTPALFQLNLEAFTCIVGQFDFFSKILHVLTAIIISPSLSLAPYLWRACPKWHAAFTGVQMFISFARPVQVCYEEFVYIYTHI